MFKFRLDSTGMSVSDVGLWWVSNLACRGLRSGKSVSMGFRWVSDNNIFVISIFSVCNIIGETLGLYFNLRNIWIVLTKIELNKGDVIHRGHIGKIFKGDLWRVCLTFPAKPCFKLNLVFIFGILVSKFVFKLNFDKLNVLDLKQVSKKLVWCLEFYGIL